MTKKTKTTTKTARWVVVSTSSRPWLVVCGRLVDRDRVTGELVLEEPRLAVYFSVPTRSVMGLATHGPQDGSRISRAAERITLRGVETIIECSPEAVERWKAEPWT